MLDVAEPRAHTPAPARAAKLARVLFAGGGTGGHVFMAVAIRDYLSRPGVTPPQTLFVGTEQGLEARILPPLGLPLETIRIGGLQKVGWRRQLSSLAQLLPSGGRSLKILRRFSPDVVVGLGGYSSGPVVAAARLLRLPGILIEPNVVPGLTNRLLARFCNGAAVAFPETAGWFSGDVRVTGIPIRQEFHRIPPLRTHGGRLRLLVFGGSRGSTPINRLMCQSLPLLKKFPLSIVHQTGSDDRDQVREAYIGHQIEAEVADFIYNMPVRFEQADLIVSRAGASTIAEITAAGRPAILIPFPQAADDHQRKNAKALAERGAAVLLDQVAARPEDLAGTIAALAADRSRLGAMGEAARTLAQPESTRLIVELMEEVAEGGS